MITIRNFRKENYSGIEKRVTKAHNFLLDLQNLMLNNPTTTTALCLAEAHKKWSYLAAAEEAFLLQKSRVTWLREGDGNTAYFHRMVAVRNSLNHVHCLENGSGFRLTSQSAMMNYCVCHFAATLGGPSPPPSFSSSDISSLLSYWCSSDTASLLEKPFSASDIKEALFSFPRIRSNFLLGLFLFLGTFSISKLPYR